jgi:hypothetical protein
MKPKTFLLGTLTGIISTIVILAIVFAVLLTRPVPVASAPAAAAQAEVVLSVDEVYLSNLATGLAQSEDSVIHAIAVDFRPGALVDIAVEGQLQILGIQIAPKAILGGAIEMSDGRLTFLLQKITVVGISIPRGAFIGPLQTAVTAMEEALNQSVRDALDESRLEAVSLTTDEACVTMGFRGK